MEDELRSYGSAEATATVFRPYVEGRHSVHVERPSTPPLHERPPEANLDLHTPDNPLSFLRYIQLKTAFESAGLGTLKYCTNESNKIPPALAAQIVTTERIEDYEGNESAFTISINTTDAHGTLKLAKQFGILAGMIGGKTSGTKNFGNRKTDYGEFAILAIQNPKLLSLKSGGKDDATIVEYEQTDETKDPWYPKAGEYVLTENTIFAGLGMTPILISELSKGRGQMIDLTTKDSADHTATYMTGGQGPSRFKPSQFIKRVIVSDGEKVFELTGEDIKQYEGTLGLHLAVLAVEYYRFETQKNKFLFFAPLNVTALSPEDEGGDWATPQAEVVGHLQQSLVEIDRENFRLKSSWKGGYIRGIETMTRGGINIGNKYSTSRMASELLKEMDEKDGDGDSFYSLYIPGECKEDPVELLIEAVQKYGAYEEFELGDPEDHDDTLEHVEELRAKPPVLPTDHNPFEMMVYLRLKGIIRTPRLINEKNQFEQCEGIRESIPDSAKAQAKQVKAIGPAVSESTDNNVGIKPEVFEAIKKMPPDQAIAKLIELHRVLLAPALKYDSALHHLQKELDQMSQTNGAAQHVRVHTHHYGHWNNAHQRYTVEGDIRGVEDPEVVAEITRIQAAFAERAKAIHTQLTDDILALRENPELEVYEGEKGLLPQYRLLTEEQIAFLLQQIEDDPHDTSRLLGWRIEGTKQKEYLYKKRNPDTILADGSTLLN